MGEVTRSLEESSVGVVGVMDGPGPPRPGRVPRSGPYAWWGLLGLIGLLAAAYAQTLGFEFVWEDNDLLFRGPLLRGKLTWPEILSTSQATYHTLVEEAKHAYRPLLALSLLLDYSLWGLRPAGFHLTSVLAHLAAVLLVGRLAWWMSGSRAAGFLGGALLAVHPSAVEAVAFLSARMDVFIGLGISAVLLLIRGCVGSGGNRRLAGALLCCTLALGSKETAAAIPAMVTWAAWAWPQWFGTPAVVPRPGTLTARVAPFWVVLGVYAVFRFMAIGGVASVPMRWTNWPAQGLRALVAIGTYAELTLIPQPVKGLYTVDPPTGFADWRLLVGAATVMVLVAGPLWLRRRHPAPAVALGLYALALLPVSNIIPVYYADVIQVAERSLYPALVGWCLFLAVGGHALWGKWRAGSRQPGALAPVMGAIVVGTFLLLTTVKVGAWRNDVTLWRASLVSHPNSFLTRLNAGWALLRAGDTRGAQAIVQEATERFPPDPRMAFLAGQVAEARGQPAEALRHYERAVALGSRLETAYRQLALLAARQGQWEAAGHWFAEGTALYPKAAWPHVGLGWLRERQGRPDLARASFDQAARLEPNSPERPWVLSQLLAAEGRRAEAVLAAQAALAMDPGFLSARRALALVAEQAGQTGEAIHHWRYIAADGPRASRGEALEQLRRLEAVAAGTSPATPR